MNKLLLLLLFTVSTSLYAQKQSYVDMSAAVVQIASEHYIVTSYKNEKKWHTYWKNPGDAGLPLSVEFKLNGKAFSPVALEWPTPKKYIEQGNILAYGYEGSYQLFFKVPKSDVDDLKNAKLWIMGKWLVCKDICIPGSEEITLKLDANSQGKSNDFKLNKLKVTESFEALPRLIPTPQNLEISLVKADEDSRLAFHYTLSGIDIGSFDSSSNLLTPFPNELLDYKHEELYFDDELNTIYGRLYVDWDGKYLEPEVLLPPSGQFDRPVKIDFLFQTKGIAKIVSIDFKEYSLAGDKSFSRVIQNFEKVDHTNKAMKKSKKGSLSIFTYILFAFIGGLILNLMPCVLPVISLKLFGLIAHQGESQKNILKHNIAYTMGILISFWVLALTVLLLKSSGEQVGWGFQLQSPIFVFIMLVLLLVMTMNMLGLFEFRTPGGKTLGNIKVKDNYSGSFVSGVLATILSTPCSAPFLGTALTFAFTTSQFNIFFIFTFVGIGLAFPFILTGLFPKLVSFLPRPGAWMEKLKNLLGVSLLLTFIWLYDVLANLINIQLAGVYLNLFFGLLFFAFYFRKKISQNLLLSVLFFALPILTLIPVCQLNLLDTYSAQAAGSTNTVGLQWDAWSKEKMQSLANDKKWVFIDFTASWCLTCKVNKKLVLNTNDFADLKKQHDIELLVGDWTKRDDKITKFLQSYDIVGVPAYFLQTPAGKVIHLGETISISKIEKAIESN